MTSFEYGGKRRLDSTYLIDIIVFYNRIGAEMESTAEYDSNIIPGTEIVGRNSFDRPSAGDPGTNPEGLTGWYGKLKYSRFVRIFTSDLVAFGVL